MKKRPAPKKKAEEKASTEEENAQEGTTEQHSESGDEGGEEGTTGKEKSSGAGSGSKSHETTEKASGRSGKSSTKAESTGESGDQGSTKQHSGTAGTSKETSKHGTGETGEGQEEEATEAPEEEGGTQAEEGEEGTAATSKGSSKKESSSASKKGSEKGTSVEESAKTTKEGSPEGSAPTSSKEGAEGSGKGSGEETGGAGSGENAEGSGEAKEGSTQKTHSGSKGSSVQVETTGGAEKEEEGSPAAPPALDLPMPEAPPVAPPEPPKRSLFGFFRKKPAAEEAAIAPEEAAKPAESAQPPQKIGFRFPFFGRTSPKRDVPAKTPPPQAPSPVTATTEPKPSLFSRFFAKKEVGGPLPAQQVPPPVVGARITATVVEASANTQKETAATGASSFRGADAHDLDIPDELGSTRLSRAAPLDQKIDSGQSSDASGGRRKESGGSAGESTSEAPGGGGESGKHLELIDGEVLEEEEQKASVLQPQSAAFAAPGPAEPPRMLTPEELTARRISGLKNQLLVYTLFCFVVLIAGIGVLVACAFKFFGCLNPTIYPSTYMINENTTCLTDDCTDFVSRASDSMTDSVLPCEDFYEHVCGGWMHTTKVPPYRYVTSTRFEAQMAVDDKIIDLLNKTIVPYTSQHAVQKAAALYKGCTNMGMRNTKGTKPLENLLDAYGIPRWPIVHADFQLNVMNTLANMIRELGLSAIVSVRVGPDHHDTRRHIVYLGQPEFGVEREVLRSPFGSPYFRIRHRYKLFIFRSAQILGSTVAAAEAVVNDIVHFEGRLASLSEEPTDLPNPKKSFHLISLESLESTVPNMQWTSFLNAVLKDAQVILGKYDRIILSNRQYLLRLGSILAEAKPMLLQRTCVVRTTDDDDTIRNVVANYLAWRVVELMGPLTVERLRRCRFRFDRYRYSQMELPELSRECYEHTAHYMRFATAKLLYDDLEEKPEERHDKVQHIADEVKDAFAVWLDLTSWMTESNKKLAVFKLRDVKVNPGAPFWVKTESEVDEYYARIPDLKREEFFESSIAVMKEYVLNDFLRLRRHGYRSDFGWIESQPQADPVYQYLGNYMLLPHGVVHPPFFWLEASPSINFGALGTLIAYYLTLGFGAYGSMYNHKGILDDWWSGMTRRQYGAESVCFKKQVEWFTNPFTGEEINGTINQDELVADNAAIKESFKAYRVYMTKYEEYYKMVVVPGMEMYNQDQIFFIAYAMTMCEKVRRRAFYYDLYPTRLVPNHHRTNLALMNFDRFSVAFDCPLGSPMNPELKCDVY